MKRALVVGVAFAIATLARCSMLLRGVGVVAITVAVLGRSTPGWAAEEPNPDPSIPWHVYFADREPLGDECKDGKQAICIGAFAGAGVLTGWIVSGLLSPHPLGPLAGAVVGGATSAGLAHLFCTPGLPPPSFPPSSLPPPSFGPQGSGGAPGYGEYSGHGGAPVGTDSVGHGIVDNDTTNYTPIALPSYSPGRNVCEPEGDDGSEWGGCSVGGGGE